MNIVGLITEYNPFHNGHLYHIQKAKEITKSDYAIVVMSGNYVQRGEPAFIDKWSRTQMALNNGADVVIELPTYYSSATADLFSFGAIKLLDATGIVSHICFGSETGDMNTLNMIAGILHDEPEEYKEHLKNGLAEGLGFATSRTNALYNYISSNNLSSLTNSQLNNILSSPNNILGIEYVKWLRKLDSDIIPTTIKRSTVSYHSKNMNNEIASASGIRNGLRTSADINKIRHTIPTDVFDMINQKIALKQCPVNFDFYSDILNYIIATKPLKQLEDIQEINEGLENRIYKFSKSKPSISELIDQVSTKRYTKSKISRILLNILLNIKKEDFQYYHNNKGPQYIKVLGFKKSSSNLLTKLKNNCTLPLVTNINNSIKQLEPIAKQMLLDECRFTDIYSLALNNIENGLEYTKPIIINPN